jgi:hypothetical protein
MTTLFDQVTKSGYNIDDEMKYEYLKKSILKSSNRIFNQILEYADYAENHSYQTLIAKLQVKWSASQMIRYKDRINNISSSANHLHLTEEEVSEVTATEEKVEKKKKGKEHLLVLSQKNPNKDHTCSLCGKKGHLEAKCFSHMTCELCGQKGHPKFTCPTRPKGGGSGSSGGANTQISGTKVKFAETFNSKFPKKKKSK